MQIFLILQAEMVNEALQTQRMFLQMAFTHQEPAPVKQHFHTKPCNHKYSEILKKGQ